MNKLIISFLLLFAAFPAFSEERINMAGSQERASSITESGGELITPRGNVSVGMSVEKLYDIFQEHDRILIPHAILSKSWLVFRDFTSKDKNGTVTFFLNAGKVTGWKREFASSPENKGSKYEYDSNERIDAWFFPKDRAKWDGSKLILLEWNKLTKAQKVTFIIEYLKEFNKQYHTNIAVDIDRYIIGMDYFNDNCPQACINISASDAINNLLISDGKAREVSPAGK